MAGNAIAPDIGETPIQYHLIHGIVTSENASLTQNSFCSSSAQVISMWADAAL